MPRRRCSIKCSSPAYKSCGLGYVRVRVRFRVRVKVQVQVPVWVRIRDRDESPMPRQYKMFITSIQTLGTRVCEGEGEGYGKFEGSG